MTTSDRNDLLLKDILKPQQVIYDSQLHSKKQVLQEISTLFNEQTPWLSSKEILTSLLERERIGSTAIGHGIAIPHCRSEHIHKPIACLLSLKNSIDFNSVDDKPVNIVFALMVPETEHKQHLELLAQIAKLLDKEDIRKEISNISNSDDLFSLIGKY